MDTENELTKLLHLWRAPFVRRELWQRIVRSIQVLQQQTSAPLKTIIVASELDCDSAIRRPQIVRLASPRNTSARTEVLMKRCNACEEEFADKFSFCPIDGSPLTRLRRQQPQLRTEQTEVYSTRELH